MSLLDEWFARHVTQETSAPLFDEEGLVVTIFPQGALTKLRRHPDFDRLMITIVEEGLARDDWQGFVYVMHLRREGRILPLYVGKAERRGVKHALSYNLANIRRNHQAFGRWGCGIAYHLGDLSHAMFGGQAYKPPDRKYQRWAERLFTAYDPPTLRERVYVALIGWEAGMHGPSGLVGSVAAVEKELIALASVEHPDTLLNVDGR